MYGAHHVHTFHEAPLILGRVAWTRCLWEVMVAYHSLAQAFHRSIQSTAPTTNHFGVLQPLLTITYMHASTCSLVLGV